MKLLFEHFFLAMVTLFQAATAFSQATPLTAGDIAFIGINNTDNTVNGTTTNDDLCFILLKNINAGTTIYFTDFGWRSDAQAFQTANPCNPTPTGSVSDGIVKWEATDNMVYGEKVLIRCKVTPSANRGTATGFQANFTNAAWFVNISVSGESIFAYTGTASSPNLLAGINLSATGWAATLANCTYNPTISTQPIALNASNTSFTFTNANNMRLKAGVVVPGDPVAARAFIATAANWEFSASALVLPATFTVLPLTLTSFTINATAGSNELNWHTSNETGVSRYEVERSTDGVSFTKLGVVNANGRLENTYAYTDSRGTATLYYRLRMIDADGRTTYSKIVLAKYTGGSSLLSVYPNPATDKVTLFYNGQPTGKSSVWLTDANGRTLAKAIFANGKASFDLTAMAAGIYLVNYKDDAVSKSLQVSKP